MLNLKPFKHILTLDADSGPATQIPYSVEIRGRAVPAQSLAVEGNRVVAGFPGVRVYDDFDSPAPGLVSLRRRWRFAARARVGMLFAWETRIKAEFWLVPAVMYNGNPHGEGEFPRGGVEVGWSFREDRIPVPNMSFISGGGRFAAVFSSPAPDEDMIGSVRTFEQEGEAVFEIRTPYIESPRRHCRKWYPRGMPGPVRIDLEVEPGEELERTFYLAFGCGDQRSWARVLHQAWRGIEPDRPRPEVDWARFVRAKAWHLDRVLTVSRSDAHGCVTSMTRGMVPLANFISGGFLGKNIEIAASLYRVGRETGDQAMLESALRTAGFFLNARLHNGLMLGDYLLFRRRWKGSFFHKRGLSTRVMGEMGAQYLKLHDLAAAHGRADREWLFAVRDLCRFFRDNQLPNGSYGKWWSAHGELIEDSGTGGAYMIPVMVRMAGLERDESMLAGARAAADFHIAEHVEKQTYWGDALDSNCIDREGGHSVCCAMIEVFEATGRPEYLDAAIRAAEYLLSWTFCWDAPLPPRSPLGRRGFRTRGGTSVSTAHHHLDPYGLAVALPYLRLSRLTGDERWRDYALELAAYSAQLVADEDDGLGFGPVWRGYQPEQVNHTDWDYISPTLFGRGAAKNIIAWVPALTLGAVLELRDRFPGDFGFELEPAPEAGPDPPAPRLGRLALNALSRLNPVS